MKMKRAFICTCMLMMGFAASAEKLAFLGTTDKNPLEYALNETITFTVTLVDKDNGNAAVTGRELKWTLSGDDSALDDSGTATSDTPLVVTTASTLPGFVRLKVQVKDNGTWLDGKDNVFDGGAGADVKTLVQSKPEPKNFDAFWKRCRDELAAVPVKADLEEIQSPTEGVRLNKVKVACPGGTGFTTGYLSVPVGEKKLKAVAHFFGYGASWGKGAYMPPSSVPPTAIHFFVSAHGFELGREPAYYQSMRKAAGSNGFGHGFDPKQNAKPETCYFHGMALRVMRAVEYLKTRPEWNGRDLVVGGGSQGSLQAMWCAAFVPGVTEAQISIPWLCDVGGTTDGRNHGDWFPKWTPGLDYFDQVNVAKRVPKTCRVTISRVGLGDYIAPPCGVAMMFNNLTCPKHIVWVQGSTHGYVPKCPQTVKCEK